MAACISIRGSKPALLSCKNFICLSNSATRSSSSLKRVSCHTSRVRVSIKKFYQLPMTSPAAQKSPLCLGQGSHKIPIYSRNMNRPAGPDPGHQRRHSLSTAAEQAAEGTAGEDTAAEEAASRQAQAARTRYRPASEPARAPSPAC
jgi:hypothetical protein